MSFFKKYNLKVVIKEIKKYYKYLLVLFIVSLLLTGATYSTPIINQKIIDEGITNKRIDLVVILVILYFITYLIQNAITVLRSYLKGKFRFKVNMELKYKLLKYYIYRKKDVLSIEIDTIMKRDIPSFVTLITGDIQDIIVSIIEVITSFVLIMSLDVQLSIVIIIIQLFVILIQFKLNEYLEKNSENLRGNYIEVIEKLNEIILNIKNIALINAEKYALRKYRDSSISNFKQENKSNIMSIGIFSGIEVLNNVTTCLILLIGGYKVINGSMTIGVLVSFIQFATLFTSPLRELMSIPSQLSEDKASIIAVTTILKEIDCKNNPNINKLSDISQIIIRNLNFSYNINNNIFNSANVVFKKNEINFIIGKSGIGKSTLVKLILGINKCNRDTVLLGEFDINDLEFEHISDIITWVPQEPIILKDTIRNNITFGIDIPEKKLIEVCRDMEIIDFINSQEEGFETTLDEYGDNVSVGQKHRICLARALLQNKPILIIDEATAGLDKETEYVIRERISPYLEDKIVIIITHSKEFITPNSNVYEINNRQIMLNNNI